ncbi:hypothetical protein HRI_000411300 [Hibiscus trionum]|uniref:Uncharacterized protein n=1 Tax=Hibiscus trionum TaxID=183268 RepID=A0A9W7H0W4_HIBTR|nr:hypothetical protein HRI_000411300 [Hibiscus trionum]
MSEIEGFFTFTNGLQRWAQIELERKGVQELSKALTTTKFIAWFEVGKSKFSKPQSKVNGRGDKDDHHSSDGDEKPNRFVKPLEKKERGPIRFYHCDSSHLVKGCPKKRCLDAIVDRDDEQGEGECQLGGIVSVKAIKPREEEKLLKCYRCNEPYLVKECMDQVEPSKEEEKPKSSEALKIGSMLLSYAKARKS